MRIAPSELGAPPRIVLDRGPLENACRPAVDALFCSAAQIYGGAVLAIVMTGMGQDGLRGARALRSQGARILAQDESSSAVWGMPRAVIEAGLADVILPLHQSCLKCLIAPGRRRSNNQSPRGRKREEHPSGQLSLPARTHTPPIGYRAGRW